jgi:hypothetical protein
MVCLRSVLSPRKRSTKQDKKRKQAKAKKAWRRHQRNGVETHIAFVLYKLGAELMWNATPVTSVFGRPFSVP